jgi:uncharacterized protein YjdB
MTRSKLTLLALLAATLAACGGRSALKLSHDGGDDIDGSATSDARRDGILDGARGSDVRGPDGLADSRVGDGGTDRFVGDALAADGRDAGISDARLDGVRNDGGDAGIDAAPTLASIDLSPPSATLAVGIPYNGFVVTAVFSDGTTSDVTARATFAVADASVLQAAGRTITGLKAGSTTVKATYNGQSAVANVTVTSAALASITVDGASVVSVGQYVLLTATGVFADGTKQDVSAKAAWVASDTSLATLALDSATSKEKLTGVKAGTLSVTATLQGITGKATLTVTAAAMTRIDITPPQPILQKGVTQEFKATATYADGTTSDVTLQATWASSATAVATVTTSASGVLVRAVDAGGATITATIGTVTGKSSVTVTAPTLASIAVAPTTWAANVGATQQFAATGTYSDGTTSDLSLSVTWSSTSAGVVAISNATAQKGQATAMAVGTAQVQAALSGVTGSANVTVSASPLATITITPDPLNLVFGLQGQLVATATYQNGSKQVVTDQVAWTSSDPSIVTISNAAASAGRVSSIGLGTTSVVATLAGVSGKSVVNVSEAKLTSITVTPATASVTAGTSQAYTAIGNYDNGSTPDLTSQVTWSSSDIAVAQVSNAAGSKGVATSLIAGTATITATLSGITGSASLTVGAPQLSSLTLNPSSADIEVGATQAFTATAVYQNGTTSVVAGEWTSSDPSVATVAAAGGGGGGPGGGGGRRGVVTGVAAGQATITVTYQGLTASAVVSVTAVPTLVGLSVRPPNPASILVGATQQFQAEAIYSNGTTTTVTGSSSWTSSNADVASVTTGGGGGPGGGGGRGLARGVGAGTATITATYDGFSATASLTVRDPSPTGLLVTPATSSVRVGGTQQFTATLTLEDGTSQTVTNQASWTTSDGAVATITTGGGGGPGGGGGGGRGLATGIGAGSATITATYSGFSATASIAVTSAKATGLVVTPPSFSMQVTQSQGFVATLVYDDGTTAVVTGQSTWSSSDPTVATITTSGGGGPGGGGPGGGSGTATGIAVGTTTISAAYGGFTGSATLTVTDPPLAFVQVTPTNPSVPVQSTTSFTAMAVFTDNSTRNVTTSATWSSSNTQVAVVSGSGFAAGRASALAEGTSTITATYLGVSGTSVLTVAGTVSSVSITPVNPTTVVGLPVAFTATAILSNGSSMVVPAGAASWVTSDPAIATVTNGNATPVKAGTATITATYLGKSGSTSLTIGSATLSSISISPSPVSLSLTTSPSQELLATGTYSDGSTHDLTGVATWLSSAAAVATVSNAAGSHGLVTALSAGTSNVTAVFQSVTSAADVVTVTP